MLVSSILAINSDFCLNLDALWQERVFSQPSSEAPAWPSHLLCWTLVAIQPEWTTAKSTMPTQLRRSLQIDFKSVFVANDLASHQLSEFEADVQFYVSFADAVSSEANPWQLVYR